LQACEAVHLGKIGVFILQHRIASISMFELAILATTGKQDPICGYVRSSTGKKTRL
jgi:hypothetical protein